MHHVSPCSGDGVRIVAPHLGYRPHSEITTGFVRCLPGIAEFASNLHPSAWGADRATGPRLVADPTLAVSEILDRSPAFPRKLPSESNSRAKRLQWRGRRVRESWRRCSSGSTPSIGGRVPARPAPTPPSWTIRTPGG